MIYPSFYMTYTLFPNDFSWSDYKNRPNLIVSPSYRGTYLDQLLTPVSQTCYHLDFYLNNHGKSVANSWQNLLWFSGSLAKNHAEVNGKRQIKRIKYFISTNNHYFKHKFIFITAIINILFVRWSYWPSDKMVFWCICGQIGHKINTVTALNTGMVGLRTPYCQTMAF